MTDQAFQWICWGLMAGAAMTAAWFFEAVFAAALRKPATPVGPLGSEQEGQGRESVLTPGGPPTSLGRFNAWILENPWIHDFLERDYYGLGQKRDMEPAKMIINMEKAALLGAVSVVILSVWLDISLNPGLIFMGFVGGFFMPHLSARRAIEARQKEALMNLPSFVDLLALTIESGLDYLNSMERIVTTAVKKKGPLEEEVENIIKEVQLGYPRRDALRHFAKRMDIQEVRSLVGLLIQSDELGTGLVSLLRNFSQDMRNRRMGKAEEMAGKAATKMLGPMMIFIFPVIFALILSPFAYSLMKGGGLPF